MSDRDVLDRFTEQDIFNRTQLYFRRAVIYDNLTAKTDVLRVRVIPDMIGYKPDDLPYYPFFDSTQVIKGVSEKDSDITKATQIWVICTNDNKVGWVLGFATSQYSSRTTKVSEPWPFSAFKSQVMRCHLDKNFAKYDELKVLFSNHSLVNSYDDAGINGAQATAISLDVVNVRTGDRVMMLQSGTTFALTQNQIYMRVGSPDQDVSFIKITAGAIEITSNQVILYGRNKTSLGKHGMKVCGMLGAPTAVDGSPIVPLMDITC